MTDDRIDRLADELRARVSERLVHEVQARGPSAMSAADRRAAGASLLRAALADHARACIEGGRPVVSPDDEDAVFARVISELFEMGALQQYLEDPTVMEVNATGLRTWIRRTDGTKEAGPPLARSNAALVELIRMLASQAGAGGEARLDAAHPKLDRQLPNGDRLFALIEVSAEPILRIRRHNFIDLVSLPQLRDAGMLDEALCRLLTAAVLAKLNVIICGGTGTGKTTLLRAMCNVIPPEESLALIEDSPELGLDRFPDLHPDLASVWAREPNIEGEGEVTIADLTRWMLRANADRIIVGEVRGAEVIPMLSAMALGTQGSLCSVHSNSSKSVFSKLATYAVQAPERLPLEATNQLIASAVDLVVHVERDDRRGAKVRRYVSSVRQVVGADGPMVVSNEVFVPGPDLRAVPGTPLTAEVLARLEGCGFDAGLLERRDGWWR
ncbi:MAG TPA: ATPase, T2SS/T4P/T4SS family [Acidimicrobiales bacterium]|nr:ATPase, T2SS/T4P/T4SS family [Acidimicrobiales bacterium]